ncbi:MAG: ornithine carbamoyltransferase, partial [bacterium]
MGKLSHKDFISIHDLTSSEIEEIFSLAFDLKKKQQNSEKHEYLWAKAMVMIFEKPSTRTRVSFEIGMWQLGGLAISLDQEAIGLGIRESVGDVAKTLSRFADVILIRTFAHAKVIELAKEATVPVINALSDLLHPCQAMADLFTIKEKKGSLKGLKLAYIGDGNNVCHS